MASLAAKQVAEEVLATCTICGYDRATEKCHIYPTRIIKKMIHIDGFNKEAKIRTRAKGKHYMILCLNCHWLYDHFLLKKDEFDKIRIVVLEGLKEFQGILVYYVENSVVPNGFLEQFLPWNNKMAESLERFYG